MLPKKVNGTISARDELSFQYHDGISKLPSELVYKLYPDKFAPSNEETNMLDDNYSDSAFDNNQNMMEQMTAIQRNELEKIMMQKILLDNSISSEKKEYIAKAILLGDYVIGENKHPNENYKWNTNNLQKLRDELILNRHNLEKPKFLQIVSKSSELPKLRPKEVREDMLDRIRMESLFQRSASQAELKEQQQRNVLNQSMEKRSLAETNRTKSIQHQIAKDREGKAKRMKENSNQMKYEIMQFKSEQQDSIIQKAKMKKKLQEFRERLRNHLKLRGENQIGNIMRLIDESMIYHFMEKYEGISMTTDAILSFLGSSLGATIITPDPAVLSPDRVISRNARVQDVEMRTHPLLSPYLNPFYALSTHHKGTVHDIWSEETSPPYGQIARHSLNRTEYEPLPYSIRTSARDRSIPRAMSADKTLGSGFRVRSKSPPNKSTNTTSKPPVDPLAVDTQEIINIMQNQLVVENLLPSLRPPRVLSNNQLKAIARRKKSFSKVANEILDRNEDDAPDGNDDDDDMEEAAESDTTGPFRRGSVSRMNSSSRPSSRSQLTTSASMKGGKEGGGTGSRGSSRKKSVKSFQSGSNNTIESSSHRKNSFTDSVQSHPIHYDGSAAAATVHGPDNESIEPPSGDHPHRDELDHTSHGHSIAIPHNINLSFPEPIHLSNSNPNLSQKPSAVRGILSEHYHHNHHTRSLTKSNTNTAHSIPSLEAGHDHQDLAIVGHDSSHRSGVDPPHDQNAEKVHDAFAANHNATSTTKTFHYRGSSIPLTSQISSVVSQAKVPPPLPSSKRSTLFSDEKNAAVFERASRRNKFRPSNGHVAKLFEIFPKNQPAVQSVETMKDSPSSSTPKSFNMYRLPGVGEQIQLEDGGTYRQSGQQAPLAIKTRDGSHGSLDPELGRLPNSPYKSYSESSLVLTAGVAAGVGLTAYRVRHKTKDGRYRAGLSSREIEERNFQLPPFVAM